MRIYVHDYAGHPFQVQLSRALAARGHVVRHGYSATNLTPQGALARKPSDLERFEPDPIVLPSPVDKRARSWRGLVARRQAEAAYGRLLVQHVDAFEPDTVLAANTPIDALSPVHAWARQRDSDDKPVRIVNWLQDLLSVGTDRVLRKRLPLVGGLVGRRYLAAERRMLREADAVVIITDDFRPILDRWGLPADRVHTVENWAPLDEMPTRPRDNDWAREHGLADRRVVLYAGTLGMKHNPALLLSVARHLDATDPEARMVVVSEGAGADWLHEHGADLSTLCLLPFQPFNRLPDVHASADILAAVLEPDAGVFSVPSKVLSYLCAARPVLLAVPPENLVARIVTRERAGVVVPPSAETAFAREAAHLLEDDPRRASMSRHARVYAEQTFDIERITDRFEAVLMP